MVTTLARDAESMNCSRNPGAKPTPGFSEGIICIMCNFRTNIEYRARWKQVVYTKDCQKLGLQVSPKESINHSMNVYLELTFARLYLSERSLISIEGHVGLLSVATCRRRHKLDTV